MPFYITHPARYHEEVIVNLPEDWNFTEMMEEMKCAAFSMRGQAKYGGRKLKLKYEYESLKDHVLPSEATAFFKEYESFEENLSYSLSKGDGSTTFKDNSVKKIVVVMPVTSSLPSCSSVAAYCGGLKDVEGIACKWYQ
ncbi:hypothetical protein [Paraflavitalea speifideaquila]|uniref:hypothetical protein n=1 Tax=Paraflavitalea speifideaquila TaxID=3076558 RepID=UPI0028EA8E02|nr:hypothetical protein [Paraflavitalea speifideiaquila]